MAAYTVTFNQVVDNYRVVQTLTPNEVEVGQSIVISNMGATYNGTFTVYAIPIYLYAGIDTEGDLLYDTTVMLPNQILFAQTTADLERIAATGTVTYTPTCTWVTVADVEDWLGFTVTNPSADYDLLTMAVGAANAWAYRKRQEAGYFDSLSTVPSLDVKLGTVMYGGGLYRERGSVDQFASYDALATVTATSGGLGSIMRLLGVNRPQVA
jgi:hypothetical protein